MLSLSVLTEIIFGSAMMIWMNVSHSVVNRFKTTFVCIPTGLREPL
eukprot:SAG11_NODE_25892_length_352_cov_1.426877_1_plen_45_part_10